MATKSRSRSLLRAGFDIDPNQLSTNFNKKNQIGFKLKLLENIRNSKKAIEKYEEVDETNVNNNIINNGCSNIDPKQESSTKKEKLMNYLENYRKRNNSLNPLNSNRDQNEITDRYPNRQREKSMTSSNLVLNNNLKIKTKIDNQHSISCNYNKEESLTDDQKAKQIIKNHNSCKNVSLINNKEQNSSNNNINNNNHKNNTNDLIHLSKLIDDIDSNELNLDLNAYINQNCSIDDETKILDVWIDYEMSLIENKSCKHYLLKLLYLFYNNFTSEKTIFLNEQANKNYYKLVKLLLSISVASLFVIVYVGFDFNIKAQLKKLSSAISKPLVEIYMMFGIKKLSKNISDDLVDKFNKYSTKNYKINKSNFKNPNILLILSKEIDSAGLSLKQFSK